MIEPTYEPNDVDAGCVLRVAVAFAVTLLLVSVLVWGVFRYFGQREQAQAPMAFPLAAGEATRLPPEPRLQTNPRGDLADMRERENRVLTTYGWVDRNAGIVRIPIDRAMSLTLERGLPVMQSGGGTP